MRQADADLLSLALIDARNRTLRWLALFEHQPPAKPAAVGDGASPALWLAGHAGWYQERCIARNLQRSRGAAADMDRAPLASIDAEADRCFDPQASTPADRWRLPLPSFEATRHYLADTLETTCELLAGVDGSDAALHWFRAALFAEDAAIESFALLAQAAGIADAAGLAGEMPSPAPREPLVFGDQRLLPEAPGRRGWHPDNETAAFEGAVPGFEIDAHPVSWSAFAEFIEDGGYDDPHCWTEPGRAWLQRHERRGPRDVEQVRGGVLLRRFGRLQRVPASQAALGLTVHEAEAWCRWAGRRLPTEIEWEIAARQGRSRGFAWGDVAEWTLGSASASTRAQRGLPWVAPRRLAHPRARRSARPEVDANFCGFRSCAP